MKTIEEKAKAYDEALERAKYYYNEGKTLEYADDIASDIFPELRKSNDEKIRKALIDYFDDANKVCENPLQSYGIHTDNVIAWLKKQGQKSAWTEADDEKLENTINALKSAGKHGSFDWLSTVIWLLTIKQRIGG